MKERDGGPAFPVTGAFNQSVYDALRGTEGVNHARELATFSSSGASFRDVCAMAAMAAIVSGHVNRGAWLNTALIAEQAYDLADAMVAQRSKILVMEAGDERDG